MKFINLIYKNATYAVYMTDEGRFAVIENERYNKGDSHPIDICDNAKIARQRADIFNRYDGASMPNDFVLHTQESPYPTGKDALSTSLREIFFKHHGDDWANEPDDDSPFPYYESLRDLLAEEVRIRSAVMGMSESLTRQAAQKFTEHIAQQVEKLARGDEMPPPKAKSALDRLRSMLGTLEGED